MLVLQYTNTLLIHSLKKKQQLPCPAVHRGLPHSSVGKESVCNAGDLGSIPVLGRSPGEENGNPFQYSCLEKFSIEMLNYNGSSVTLNHALKTFEGTSLRVQFWASDGKPSAYSVGDLGLIPGSGRSLEEGNGNPLQYSCLGNTMDREAWQAHIGWNKFPLLYSI